MSCCGVRACHNSLSLFPSARMSSNRPSLHPLQTFWEPPETPAAVVFAQCISLSQLSVTDLFTAAPLSMVFLEGLLALGFVSQDVTCFLWSTSQGRGVL